MLGWSVVIFAVAALGGLALAVMHFRSGGKERPSTGLAVVHGLAAALAVVLLIAGIANSAAGFSAGLSSLAVVALVLFVVAALGGAYLFLGKHLRGESLPSAVVVIHGGVAALAFVLLLVFVFSTPAAAAIL
ncbi:hypothetical protein [Ferruginivarius sediminum]|jgi:hypothetical protein|uniref:Uncharacterized protein n=1 Tax=Ferruginivarius sediminum TaxID=2661937 RepID=A0A369TEN7_9PROT|nr:hypothetical protein [Ferruginivarius sediminum]RDD61396.1 hypothetical protein DRB17_13020 [Ferruginivarius sediminum]